MDGNNVEKVYCGGSKGRELGAASDVNVNRDCENERREGERLQKFLARASTYSRRKCEQMIMDGRVKVDGKIITRLGSLVCKSSVVELDGSVVCDCEEKKYILLNKPIGYISSVRDQFERKTVIDIVKGEQGRFFPVGRLDYNTSGLIILTNDGEFCNIVAHPKNEIEKVYEVTVRGTPDKEKLELLRSGVVIDGGFKTSPASVWINEFLRVMILIHEGKNRQVRRMFDAVGLEVCALKRVAIGGLSLSGLEEGKWKYVPYDEAIKATKKYERVEANSISARAADSISTRAADSISARAADSISTRAADSISTRAADSISNRVVGADSISARIGGNETI